MRPARVGGRTLGTNGFVRGPPWVAAFLLEERPLTMSMHQPTEAVIRDEAPVAKPVPPSRGIVARVGSVALTLLAVAACLGFAYWLHYPTEQSQPAKPELFKNWGKPDLVIVLSAEEHGYLLPCGCSHPQKGGLERRYNFMQFLRAKGWPVMALDLGDVAQDKAPVDVLANLQQLPKYKYSMLALKAMDYTAVGVGPIEANNLFALYGHYAANEKNPPVLAANLHGRETEYPGPNETRFVKDPAFKDYVETTPKGSDLKVFITSIMGAKNAESRPKDDLVQFDAGSSSLKTLQKTADKADIRVLLYEGYTMFGKNGKAEAVACSDSFPNYQILVALSGEHDEPPGQPLAVRGGQSIIVTLGHKGKYVGVVGVYKTGKPAAPYDFKYQLVELGEKYLTPQNEEKGHPILSLMEDYTAELKADNYLTKYAQRKHPLQVVHPGDPKNKPLYEGSEACKECHAYAYKVWSKPSPPDEKNHNKAYQTLVKAQRPSNRQYDPECIVCHTVGFGYDSGFFDADKTAILKNVGCENCHGPCSEHIIAEKTNNATAKAWRQAINPWKYLPANQQLKQKEMMCMKCHDSENDVNWAGQNAFADHWDLIKHYTPKKEEAVKTPADKK
jgi:hypothetical protein